MGRTWTQAGRATDQNMLPPPLFLIVNCCAGVTPVPSFAEKEKFVGLKPITAGGVDTFSVTGIVTGLLMALPVTMTLVAYVPAVNAALFTESATTPLCWPEIGASVSQFAPSETDQVSVPLCDWRSTATGSAGSRPPLRR